MAEAAGLWNVMSAKVIAPGVKTVAFAVVLETNCDGFVRLHVPTEVSGGMDRKLGVMELAWRSDWAVYPVNNTQYKHLQRALRPEDTS